MPGRYKVRILLGAVLGGTLTAIWFKVWRVVLWWLFSLGDT